MEHLKSLLLDLEKSVQCAICLQSLTNPVTTRCDHNFCNLCITKVFTGKSQIPCPLCKKVIRNRSLKKADHLRSLIPLVHQVTNQLQEKAEIPYTLSQSTRPQSEPCKKIPPAGSTLSPCHNDSSKSQESPKISEVLCATRESTNEVLQNDIQDSPENDVEITDASKDLVATNDYDQTNGVQDHSSNGCNQEKEGANEVDNDSHNVVEKVIISAQVHRSPLREIESSVEQLGRKRVPNQNNTAIQPLVESDNIVTTLASEINQDPYVFPISQPTIEAKKVAKKITRKNPRTSARKRKSPSDCGRAIPKRPKRSPRPSSDHEIQKEMMQSMIDEVENHSLAIETVDEDRVNVAKPEKKGNRRISPGERDKKQKFESHKRKDHPILARRLLSDSTSDSSDSEQGGIKGLLPKHSTSQQSIEDKVQSWLQTTSPSAKSDSGPVSPQRERFDAMSDDDVSHSQVSVERLPDRVIVLKRRRFISPLKLDPKIQQSVRSQLWSREVAVFGNSKAVKTYLPKTKRDVNYPLKLTQGVVKKNKQTKSKRGKHEKVVVIRRREPSKLRQLKDPELKNIFDVPGLSQGVSPFGTQEEMRTNIENGESALIDTGHSGLQMAGQDITKIGVLPEVTGAQVHDTPTTPTADKYHKQDKSITNLSGNGEGISKEQTLREVVEPLISPAIENYDIQEDSAENGGRGNVAVPLQDCQKTKVDNNAVVADQKLNFESKKDSSTILHPSLQKTPENDAPRSKKIVRKTPRGSRSNKLPSLGESPTVSASQTLTKQSKSVSTPAPVVELGLLDFSEPMHDAAVTKALLPRTKAVTETCRMVMESFDKLSQMEDVHAGSSKERLSSVKIVNDKAAQNTSLGLEKSCDAVTAYDTDNSIIPPSTSTANLEMPGTPAQCDLDNCPTTLESAHEDDPRQSISATPKKNPSDTTIVISPNRNIIKNAPLPGETEFSEVEKQIIQDVTQLENFDAIAESSGSDDERAGSLRCLTNGWGGTKLRIFRSTGSDTDSNLSSKTKKNQKANGDTSSSVQPESTVSSPQQNGAVEIGKSSQCLPSDIIQSSEKISDSITNSENTAPVRKSARRNKGRHMSFDFETSIYPRKKKHGTTVNTEETGKEKKTSSAVKKDSTNVVLQHLRNAMAEMEDLDSGSKIKGHEKTTNEVKSAINTDKKLIKIHPKKKQPIANQHRLQTGKRTKMKLASSLLDEGADPTHSLGHEKLSISWPVENNESQTTFICSQPMELPKHLTSVSVRVTKLVKSSGNVASDGCSNNGFYGIDSSPLLFASQGRGANDVNRQDLEKRKGRSISIDLSKPSEQESAPVLLNDDLALDSEEFLHEDTDDVICCSWNDEEKMEAVAASCHEDECSVASGQVLSRPNTPNKKVDDRDGLIQDHEWGSLTESPDLVGIISSLKKISLIKRDSVNNLIPKSMDYLILAIDACVEACSAIESELHAKEEKATRPVMSESHNSLDAKRGDLCVKVPSKQRKTRSSIGQKFSPAISIDTLKTDPDLDRKAVVRTPLKRDPSVGETPSTSGLKFRTKPAATCEEHTKALDQDKNDDEKSELAELQDYFNEVDDMALFGESDIEQDKLACGIQGKSLTDLSASVEQAMTELEPERSGLLSGKSNQTTKEPQIEDFIAATQDSCKVDDPGATDVVASNVDSWLKRLSDLNKRKAEIQKKKIGDKWKSSPRSQFSIDCDSEKMQDDVLGQEELDNIDENLHGIQNDHVKQCDPEVYEDDPKSIVNHKADLQALSSSKPESITSDQLPQLSIVIARTPVEKLRVSLQNSADKIATAKDLLEVNGPCDHKDNNENVDPPDVNKDHQPGVEEWLNSRRPRTTPSPTDLLPVTNRMGIITTGLQEKEVRLVKIFARRLNSQYYPTFDQDKVTHVVVHGSPQRSCDRTLKYLQGISGRKWVVDLKWVTDYFEQDKLLPESDYEILGDNCMRELDSDDCEFPKGPMKSRISDPDFKLLHGYRCVCLPPYTLITIEQARGLLEMCGATVVNHLGELIQSNTMTLNHPEKCLIIVDGEATIDVPDYSALGEKFKATVVNIEWVYESISRFQPQLLEDFMISGFTQDSSSTHF